MRKLFCLGLLLLAGCQNTAGPFAARPPLPGPAGGRIDDPSYSIADQESRGRDRLALPDDFSGLAPKTGAALPQSGYSAR